VSRGFAIFIHCIVDGRYNFNHIDKKGESPETCRDENSRLKCSESVITLSELHGVSGECLGFHNDSKYFGCFHKLLRRIQHVPLLYREISIDRSSDKMSTKKSLAWRTICYQYGCIKDLRTIYLSLPYNIDGFHYRSQVCLPEERNISLPGLRSSPHEFWTDSFTNKIS